MLISPSWSVSKVTNVSLIFVCGKGGQQQQQQQRQKHQQQGEEREQAQEQGTGERKIEAGCVLHTACSRRVVHVRVRVVVAHTWEKRKDCWRE